MRRRLLPVLLPLLFLGCFGGPDPNELSTRIETAVGDFAFLDADTILLQARQGFLRSENAGRDWIDLGSFCPTPPLVCDTVLGDLTSGEDGSVWLTWTRFSPDKNTRYLAISRDRGATFEFIEAPFIPIEIPGENPVFFAFGQLWFKEAESPDTVESFVPLGGLDVPSPDELAGVPTFCSGAFYVPAIDSDRVALHMWSTEDLGSTWNLEIESFRREPRIVCGTTGQLWAAIDRTILLYDSGLDAWTGIDLLWDVCGDAGPCLNRMVADHQVLYIAGVDLDGTLFIGKVFLWAHFIDFNFQRMPQPDPPSEFPYRIKISPTGHLWVSGTSGLFRFDQATENWARVWPPSDRPDAWRAKTPGSGLRSGSLIPSRGAARCVP